MQKEVVGETVAGIYRRLPSAILDFWCTNLDKSRRVFCGLYHCAKLVGITMQWL